LLAEYGWTGLALFAFFLGAHLVSAIAAVRRVLDHKLKPTATTASNELALIVGTLCAVAIGGVHAARDFTFHLPANTLFAAFLFAILANPTGETAGRRERQVFPPWIAWSTPLFAAVLFVFCVVQLWPAVLGERARIALRDREYGPALELARRASRADAQNPDACYTEGEALRYLALEAADPAQAASLRREAVAAFERGLILFPRDVRLLLKLGQVLDDLRESARADGYFARALDAAPNSGTAQACCAIHWHRQWLLEKARGFYEAARSLGETELSLPGLRDLEHDEAIVRSGDAFSGFRPERGSSASPSAVP
jgi:tetratricopeptide (TPR) repeat protein